MESRVVDNAERSRFELRSGDEVIGFAEYHVRGDELDFVHTEVNPGHEGRGLGGRLVRSALDTARQRRATVVPHCTFVRDWIGAHRDYLDLVPERLRPEFGL
ncbi:hypothetical protein FHX42_003284 [Saccharopolyspora lacisalsi]|uniref:N-acetyltransferase domain-containing protein n=1 Tax=Halosaccharopolyspora lacisalsi TaxID=1000566 RepID=A0A839E4S7_9PSEU|nr:GNAT family N-acetyltransferase [Halosaccharopolyspora lacisalsi]MBA8825918.1 hypothetical protein [Halosaccharopolyspora lacisalsi]